MRCMVVVKLVTVLSALSACSSVGAQHTLNGTPVQSVNPGKRLQPAVAMVANPWQTGDFQKGIQLYWHSDPDYVQVDATRVLDYVVDLGANSVGITFPIYVDGASPTKVYRGPDTPSVHDLRVVIKEAQARKLRVTLRPLIAEGTIVAEDPTKWRGTIGDDSAFNSNAWFASYNAVLKPYIELAEQQQVQEFVIGSELTQLESSVQWVQTVLQARSLYSGMLSYTFNYAWNTVPPVKHFGIDLYPPVPLGDDATVTQLTAALTSWLRTQKARLGSNLTVHEIGIAGRSGAYLEPWGQGDSGEFNPRIQSNWFTAAYQACLAVGIKGAYYWSVDSTQQLGKDLDVDAQPPGNFMGRPGEFAIRRAFM